MKPTKEMIEAGLRDYVTWIDEDGLSDTERRAVVKSVITAALAAMPAGIPNDKFTREELSELFPDGIPMVLVKLIFPDLSAELTVGEIRQIARALRTPAADLAAENERLRAALEKAMLALKPMANAVFNDNGDMTVSIPHASYNECIAAYFAVKLGRAALERKP